MNHGIKQSTHLLIINLQRQVKTDIIEQFLFFSHIIPVLKGYKGNLQKKS